MTGNELILMALKHEKDGNMHEAIRLYTKALDFYLYKMMWSIKNESVQNIVSAISRCRRSLSDNRALRAALEEVA